MTRKKNACFFSTTPKRNLLKEQYSLQDIRILCELGFSVTVADHFRDIPFNCDLYFSWWASGSILPLIVSKLCRRPIITIAGGNEAMLYVDSMNGEPRGYLAAPWYNRLATRITLRTSTILAVVSEFMINDVRTLGARDPIVIYNCVDTRKFDMSPGRRRYVTSIFRTDDDAVRIKRGEIFIKAAAQVRLKYPDQHFLVIGRKGCAYNRLVKLVESLDLSKHFHFVGSIPNKDVPGLLQSSMVYVQISDTETFGLAIAESMSCGTPVVVSKRGAIQEIVGDFGVYVDHNEPRSVASGILQVLDLDLQARQRLSLNSRRRIVSNFSYEKRKEKIETLINSIIGDTA